MYPNRYIKRHPINNEVNINEYSKKSCFKISLSEKYIKAITKGAKFNRVPMQIPKTIDSSILSY